MPPTPRLALAALLALAAAAAPRPGRAEAPAEGAALAAAAPAAPAAPADPPRLSMDLARHAALTGGLLATSLLGQLLAPRLAAPRCRWCEPGALDAWARRELRWRDVKAAGATSDALVVALPVGAALALGLAGRDDGVRAREVTEDLVAVTEAVAVATLLTQASKFATGRLRPDAWAGSGGTSPDSRMSFWGGHSALAFSVAAAATQVARLRGLRGWRWLAAASFAGAATTAWMRVAADRHWLTDVVVGASVGTAAGLGVPPLVLRPAERRRPAVWLAPAPGGLVLAF